MAKNKSFLSRLFSGSKSHSFNPSSFTRSDWIGLNSGVPVHNQTNSSELINEGYARITDVYSIVRKIAQTGASMNLQVFKIVDGEYELQRSGELFDLIMQPNSNQNQYEFKENGLTNLLTSGNIFLTGQNAIGFGDVFTSLSLLPPQYIDLQLQPSIDGVPQIQYIYEQDTIYQPLNKENLKHIKYFNPTDYGVDSGWGLSPLTAGYLSMIASKELNIAESSILKNKGASGLLTNKGDYPLDSDEAEQIQKAIDKKISGASKFGKIITTNASVEYIQMGMSPTDLKLIESGVVKLRQLCNLYGVDSSLFNDPENKTYNNRKEAQKSLYTESVIPSLQKFVWGLNEFIVPAFNKKDNAQYIISIDKSQVPNLFEDEKLKAESNFKNAEGFVKILESTLTTEQKVKSLMLSYHLTEDEAENIVGDDSTNEN
jgi:HK97 family phage portal protein